MRIFRALKSNLLTQKFGENRYFDYTKYDLIGHNGVDWGCGFGEGIYWDCDKRGTVVSTCNDATAGVGCDIITEDESGIFKHTFWHFVLNGLKVQSGQVLESGQLIGYGDSTGISTGNHLHRQIKKQAKDSLGRYYNLNQTNGYQGAEDIMPYFSNIFIKDYIATQQKKISLLQQIIIAYQKIIELLKMRITIMK